MERNDHEISMKYRILTFIVEFLVTGLAQVRFTNPLMRPHMRGKIRLMSEFMTAY